MDDFTPFKRSVPSSSTKEAGNETCGEIDGEAGKEVDGEEGGEGSMMASSARASAADSTPEPSTPRGPK